MRRGAGDARRRSAARAGRGAVIVALLLLAAAGPARAFDPALLAGLHWRLIGPFRGGRTVAASGVPGAPNLFYIGVNNGGVWKTTDAGRTWTPIFDAQSTGSIGALAVAPSDPRVIYVGSGEGLQRPDLSVGDGIYKSGDGGATWRHLGLRDGQQIPAVVVDPHDPNRVFAAVLGHPYGPNPERGVFRSTDGGETWQKVLYQDQDTGAIDVVLDPADPRTVFAVMWAARQPPWEGGGGSFTLSANNGLYKSSDGGTTWRRITEGLPTASDRLGRIGLAVSASEPRRLVAVVGAGKGAGLYRSDDGGEHWRLVNGDHRLSDRDGDFDEVKVDPKHADVVYVANVVCWKSTDGGRTFSGWRGAPGGDDYHRLWLDPDDPRVILLAGDQGAVVTVNGGDSWSSWYNQPTAQFYHVSTDDDFPYRVYGGQQESGSAGVLSRGDDGQITFREWHPVGAEEYGYVAPDPLHPGIVYGGKIHRFDRATGQVQDVSPDPLRTGDYRWVRTMPLLFSPVDPHLLYLAANVLFRTADGGRHWQTLSPDLTRASYDVPASLGSLARLDPEHGRHRGVIYTLAPSFSRVGLLWVGTDDGLIHVTHDGGRSWHDVTPPALTPWSKVSLMEASHFDTLEAYAAVNRFRLDDLRPHLYRTRDGGRSWAEVVAGIGADEVVNAVREDPARRGLLYAGTERGVYVSLDDGDHWQSLRLDLPATAVRDLVVHGADLVVATHGRSFWILDDLEPVRQMATLAAATAPTLLRPAPAVRVRWNTNTDTPLPPDEPAGKNPPDGAPIDYLLPRAADGPVTLDLLDPAGRLVRSLSSAAPAAPPDTDLNIPDYWIRPPQTIATAAGIHRVVWDLRGEPPAVQRHDYPIAAIAHDTAREPRGPWVLPGTYTVRLTVAGHAVTQPLAVRMDPRVHTPRAGLERQYDLALRLTATLAKDTTGIGRARVMATRLKSLAAHEAGGTLAAEADSLAADLRRLQTGEGEPPPGQGARPRENLARLNGELGRLFSLVEGADAEPTEAMVATAAALDQARTDLAARQRALEVRFEALVGRDGR